MEASLASSICFRGDVEGYQTLPDFARHVASRAANNVESVMILRVDCFACDKKERFSILGVKVFLRVQNMMRFTILRVKVLLRAHNMERFTILRVILTSIY